MPQICIDAFDCECVAFVADIVDVLSWINYIELDKLEEEFGESFRRIFQTITTDNGSEFLNCELLEKSMKADQPPRTTIYYAHPYSSWERGSNENQNRIIRRFIPKGKDIGQYSTEEIARIEHWINNYPRRQFGYESAAQRCTLMNLK